MMVALLVARLHPDRDRALDFLLSHVRRRTSPLANYFQALDILATREGSDFLRPSIPYLKEAFVRHTREISTISFSQMVALLRDTLAYMDYLSCSAALFRLTGEEESRNKLKQQSEHRNQLVRMMVRSVTTCGGTSPISL
jgi:hypothetical protein